MSRYYNIVIGAETSPSIGGAAPSNLASATFTNQSNGQAVLNAQQVEWDIPVTATSGYLGVSGPAGAKVTIRGVSLLQISQSMNFNGASISISAGMQNGLPLATAQASQAGLILQGTILSAYGNWIGVEQSLEFIITAPTTWPTQANPVNLVVNWPKGQDMATALANTLKIAFPPPWKININISPNLVFTQDETGPYQTVGQFSQWVTQISVAILGSSMPNYSGVYISVQPNQIINVFDNITQPSTPATQLNAPDFIGQPTWLGSNTIQFNTVMRSDLLIGSYITFPPPLNLQTITTSNSAAYARQNTAFQGTWLVQMIRHLGNSRGPNATDWISSFQAVSPTVTGTQLSAGNTSA